MSDNRTVTIGVVVNLGNYESLRLEVSDKADTKEAADSLRGFLVEVLDGFANNSASAKSAIEKYKKNILANAEPESFDEANDNFVHPIDEISVDDILPGSNFDEPSFEESNFDEPDFGSKDFEEPAEKSDADEPEDTDAIIPDESYEYPVPAVSDAFDDAPEQEEESFEPSIPEPVFVEEKSEPEIEPEPAQDIPKEQVSVPVSTPAEGEYFCDKCGEKITKVQRDVSNLFMGKNLCKNCMK